MSNKGDRGKWLTFSAEKPDGSCYQKTGEDNEEDFEELSVCSSEL
jgi:hypothetical protein